MKQHLASASPSLWNQKNFPSGAGALARSSHRGWMASELSRELRTGTGDFLGERRAIVVLSLVAIGAMGLISLYQTGVVKHLPEPPLPGLDADRVDASDEAYQRFSTPDAVLGLGSYALTMALAEVGGQDRARKQPWLPLGLAGKIGFDLAQVVRMTRIQWTKYRAFCFWCLVSAAATVASAVLTFGEARQAAQQIARRARK